MPPSEMIPPAGMVLCSGKNLNCGPVHYDGTKGGPKPTDELVCSGEASCEDDACDCKLCYIIKFKHHPQRAALLPWTSSISANPTRKQVEDIEKDEHKKAREFGLAIESIDWKCLCLKPKPITGKKG